MKTLEDCIATRCKVLFEPERPFMFFVWDKDRLTEFLQPETLIKMVKGRFGTVTLWGDSCQRDYVPGKGPTPTNEGRIEMRDLTELRMLIDYIHAAGMKAVTHIHPGRWRELGHSGQRLFEELERQRRVLKFDGVWFDGADIGSSMSEAIDTLTRLRRRGWWVGLHSTITPFQDYKGKPWIKCTPWEQAEAGRVWWVPELIGLANAILWGETMPGPDGLRDAPRYLKWLSGVERIPSVLVYDYPSPESDLRGHASAYFSGLPGLLLAKHAGPGGPLDECLMLYTPFYEDERRRYQENPDYVRDKAREW